MICLHTIYIYIIQDTVGDPIFSLSHFETVRMTEEIKYRNWTDNKEKKKHIIDMCVDSLTCGSDHAFMMRAHRVE